MTSGRGEWDSTGYIIKRYIIYLIRFLSPQVGEIGMGGHPWPGERTLGTTQAKR